MHNDAFSDLRSVITHHLNPADSLHGYDTAVHPPPALQNSFQNDPAFLDEMLSGIDLLLTPTRSLTQAEISHLVAFLQALTNPAAGDMSHIVPVAVLSGLLVDGILYLHPTD